MTRKVKRSKKVVFDASDVNYEIIKELIVNIFTWQIVYDTPLCRDEWFMMWYDSYVSEEDLRRLLPF